MSQSIPLLTLPSRIKRRLRSHLRALGFVRDGQGFLRMPNNSKECVREMHSAQRADRLIKEAAFIKSEWPVLCTRFANGTEVIPDRIAPRLEPIYGDTWQARLFRLASLTWSIPVSQGYGRRMRFLVWDDANDKLIGLIALGDPVFNLRVRDARIGWSAADRAERLVNVLDAFVLGSLPPYSQLLGGKLVACLIRTQTVRDEFSRRYAKCAGTISKRRKRATLALVTTTSAFGRSSVYNRLKLQGVPYFERIGFTSGWGHFHVPDELFQMIRDYLKAERHPYASNNRFGDGPNWRFRAIRHALVLLGENRDLMRHSISREVFACCLASNAIDFLGGDTRTADYTDLLTVDEVTRQAIDRWVVPRAASRPEYRGWRRDDIERLLQPERPPHLSDGRNLCVVRARRKAR